MPTRRPPPTQLFRDVLEGSPTATAVIDASGKVTWVNAAFRSMAGGASNLVGQSLFSVWPVDDPQVVETVRSALGTHRSVTLRAVTAPARGPDRSRFVDLDVRPASSDRTTHTVLTLQDVTERVREHERASLFYQAFRSSTNAMEVTDKAGILVDVNPAFESIYGYNRFESIGKKPNLVRSRHTSPEVYTKIWADLLDPNRGYWSGEIINRDRTGRERPVLLTITSVRNELNAVTHYLGVAVDLTERKAWERAAAHADKLASLGQLAAGVAHEINTPLANVLLVAESIRRKTRDEWVRSRVNTICEQVRVADRIVLGLLDFARRNEPHVVPLDLKVVAHDAVNFVQGKQTPEVELVEMYPSDPVPVLGDRNQLIQVIANVLNNAYDATGGHGRITLEVRRANGVASLDVADSGPGIPAEVLPHLFEPFFTTKPEGRGTGLGLAICHGILQAHRGTITASNDPGGGARFTVTVPLQAPAEAARTAARAST